MKSRFLTPLLVLAFLLSVLVTEAGWASWEVSSNIDLTLRVFPEDPRWPGQDDSTIQPSIAGSAESRFRRFPIARQLVNPMGRRIWAGVPLPVFAVWRRFRIEPLARLAKTLLGPW